MPESGLSDLERELYYLVTKFLENGPCTEAAEVLKRQLDENKLVIPRKDWEGNEQERSFKEFDCLNNHVQSDYLLNLTKNLNTLVGNSFPHAVRCVKSLLPRGSLSLLRNGESSKKAPDCHLVTRHSASRNAAPLLFSSKSKATPICSVLAGQSYSGVKARANIVRNCNVFSNISMHKRILGHLASVYCVLFDETGSVIVTGADDKLLKLWSAKDGRLVATFRGHAGQITDIAINKENTFVASGSLDKTIRVWKLHNTHPVAVLQGHTGMITSLKFCPSAHGEVRYLVSTGGDGNICFWPWFPETGEFSLTPVRFNEKSRAGAQMLCSSFSPGGSFLTTGSSDNYIRVYQLYPELEKIAELPSHVDHVDSIVYSNFGARFLSGSRDGTAMIWSFVAGEWQTKCLDCSKPIQSDIPSGNEDQKNKLKVTMICWSANDKYIITAGTDFNIRIWDSYAATLKTYLKGHTEDIYILETHPSEEHLLLSAGHDGNLILWDLEKFTQIKLFFNMLEGQGHGAIFDCKFSPTGLQFAATDSHGHLLIFGFGSDNRFKKAPYEQFFHTDYREIVRDSQNYVLDSQLQTAPHLMPPPYLVDIDGNPYPSQFQMLIPGRNQRNLPQLRVEEEATEDLPPLLAEIAAAEAAERNNAVRSPGPSRRQSVAADGLLSPGGGVGLRESGDVEGVRQENNLYISGDITDADAEAWRNRTIIPANTLYNQSERNRNRLQCSVDEISNYVMQKNKRNRKNSESNSEKRNLRPARGRGRGRGRGGRTRQSQKKEQVVYVRPSALRTLEYLQPYNGEVVNLEVSSESEAEDWQGESSDSTDDSDWVNEATVAREASARSKRRRNRKAQANAEEDNENESDVDVVGSKDGSSTEETTSSSEEEVTPETKKTRTVTRKGNKDNSHSDDDEDYDGDNDASKQRRSKRKKIPKKRDTPKKSPPVQKKPPVKKVKKEIKTKKPLPSVDNVKEYLAVYAPPEWLLNVETKKFPYFPQIGDEVYYLRQGHHLYVEEVIKQNEYDIAESRQAYRRYDLAPAELCKLVGISYDIGPPKMCSLKLELNSKRKATGNRRTITVRFHDMPNVVDFLVLKHIYEDSLQQSWSEDDRFRCIIDDIWYYGTITQVSPFNEEFLTSSFLSLVVRWDSGDFERVSPWDLEKIPDGLAEIEEPITEEDKRLFEYTPNEQDWPNEQVEDLQSRAIQGLDAFCELEIAGPFAYPVDVKLYPTYWGTIAFPTDLETIKKRISNGFYRRLDALLWEVRQLRTNAAKFNEEGSGIVHDAELVVKILCRFLKSPEQTDIIACFNETTTKEQAKGVYYNHDHDSEEEDEEDEEEDDQKNEQQENSSGSRAGSSSQSSSSGSYLQDWVMEAKSLLDFLSSKDDAQPFLEPVDLQQFPDYSEIVMEPIDISTIRHRLENNQYDNVEAYIRDFQLMFDNSKKFNTDRRSTIYKMTLRLSALFKSRCDDVRKAYHLNSSKNVHMTRGRSKNLTRIKEEATEDEPSNSTRSRSVRNTECNGIPNSSVDDKNKIARKSIIKVTLQDFVRRPKTRSRRRLSSDETPSSLCNGKQKRQKMNLRRNKESSEYNSSQSSESEEKIEDIIKEDEKPTLSSPETNGMINTSNKDTEETPSRRRRTSCRVPVKRVRYGFESEEEDEGEETKPPVVKKKRMNSSSQGRRKKTKKKTASKTNKALSNGDFRRRTARSKAAVSYCEDDDYEAFDDAFEPDNTQDDAQETDQEESNSSNSSSEEEEEEIVDESTSESSSSSDEENVPVAGVSSRGRVRRAATRFLDYS